jgi:hypothetical protein
MVDINGLNTPITRQRLAKWILKTIPSCYYKTHFKYKYSVTLKRRG